MMRIFVTGVAGYMGTVVVRELIGAGHQVVGLTHSECGVQILGSVGAEMTHGVLEDPDFHNTTVKELDRLIKLLRKGEDTRSEIVEGENEENNSFLDFSVNDVYSSCGRK